MGFLSSLWCHTFTRNATGVDAEESSTRSTDKQAPASGRTGFLSSFRPLFSTDTVDVEAGVEARRARSKPKDKPPKYNRHNLPSMVIEDPPPWVTNYRKLERNSDGMLVVTSPSQARPLPPDTLVE